MVVAFGGEGKMCVYTTPDFDGDDESGERGDYYMVEADRVINNGFN